MSASMAQPIGPLAVGHFTDSTFLALDPQTGAPGWRWLHRNMSVWPAQSAVGAVEICVRHLCEDNTQGP